MKCPAIVKESTIYTSIFYKDIQQARKDTNTSPSEAQIKAENYKKGTFRWNGLIIKIENPRGSTRSGTSPDGKKWSIKMKYDYGYVAEAQKSKDNDAIDIFIGDHPESQVVYVIDQTYNGKFDEHKCVIGALDEEEARKTYLANYEKGWKGLGQIKALTVEQFKEWVKSGNTRRAINKQELFKVGENMKCPMIIKEAMRVIKSRVVASTPELAKRYGVGEGMSSEAVIYKPFLRGAKGESSKKYRDLITEHFLGLSGDEIKQYKNIKTFGERRKMLAAVVKKRGWSGRTTLRARKPFVIGRKEYEKASMKPHQHISLFNKDKYNIGAFMQQTRQAFGRFKNPLRAYKSYDRRGWKTKTPAGAK